MTNFLGVAEAVSQSDVVKWMDNNKGKYLDYDGAFGAQCVDLANFYLRDVFGIAKPISAFPVGYAYQMFDYNAPSGFTKIKYTNSLQFQIGDMVIWNKGRFIDKYTGKPEIGGHVAVVYSVNGSNVKIFEQNPGAASVNDIVYKSYIRGVFRPKLDVVSPPPAPATVTLSPADIGIGGEVSVTYSTVSGATGYQINLICSTDSSKNKNNVPKTFIINEPGTYNVSVIAKNSAGNSPTKASNNIVAHPNLTVTFVDYDNTILSTVSVPYNGTAEPPSAPSREGYSWLEWDGSRFNITSDKILKATYKINTYTVNFTDDKDNILKTETVEYGSSASPPTPPAPAAGYVFLSWDTEAYKEVKQNLTVRAVFAWGNDDLPITALITSTVFNKELNVYEVGVRLRNHPNQLTRGKMIVTLKTEEDKMVASETRTFYAYPNPGNEDSLDVADTVIVPYSGIVSGVELSVVGLLDTDNTGVPLSNIVKQDVDLVEVWSNWSTERPGSADTIEEKQQYRDMDRKTATSLSSSMPGWTLYDTVGVWGEWSGWSKTDPGTSTNRERESKVIETTYKTQYHYFHYCGNRQECWTHANQDHPYFHEIWLNSQLPVIDPNGIKIYGNGSTKCSGGSTMWLKCDGTTYGGPGPWTRKVVDVQGYTEYRYRDRTYTYYFEKWDDWSDWTDVITVPPVASENKLVETRMVYRYKNNLKHDVMYNYKRYKYYSYGDGNYYYTYNPAVVTALGYPGEWEELKAKDELPISGVVDSGVNVYKSADGTFWYAADVNNLGNLTVYKTMVSLEDTTGEKMTIAGSLNAPGKKATIMVYKGAVSDPTASQLQYVGQTTLGSAGEYSFTFKTKETPSEKTGDFIVVMGVEGATAPVYLQTIYAPLPAFKVVFVDEGGSVISEQMVISGGSAVLPESIQKEGYEFVAWETSITNISDALTITAEYTKKAYQVVFVDWDGEFMEIRTFAHGDGLTWPEIDGSDGKIFIGWIDEDNNDVTVVTRNMIVSPKYEWEEYNVSFMHWDGTVISEQLVEYGQDAVMPDIEIEPMGTKVFAYWNNYTEGITDDSEIWPVMLYEQDVAVPIATVIEGAEAYVNGQFIALSDESDVNRQLVALSCETENATLYYTMDGSFPLYNDEIGVLLNGTIYEEPISITGNTIIMFMAVVDEMNPGYNYYLYSLDSMLSGDVNDDGFVNMTDVLLIYLHFRGVSLLSEDAFAAADVSGDGAVNMQDVLLVYQYFRGKIDSFQ